MSYRYSTNSDWGEMFGLSPTHLETWQLEKLNIRKLIEFITADPRVEKIIGDRIACCSDVEEIKVIDRLYDSEFEKLSYIKIKYNECIALNSDILDKSNKGRWGASRSNYVWWDKLSGGNKSQEFTRWLDGKETIILPNKIDFNWLEEKHSWLTDVVIQKIFISSSNNIIKMIPQLSKIYLLKYLSRIFDCDKSVYVHTLSNLHTPREYIIKSLRAIAGKKRVPIVRVSLDKSILKELPSVMRLETLESLLINMRGGNVSFSDIKIVEEFSELLFGTALRYNQRVQRVVKQFKKLCTQEN